ncbi:unannotated protein [freshwater metagenome]|uniref:Unannotated protein n=1 Tax=freshwater metagenome TaxID=449393 RepID=A0A6J7HGM1_9ZZZZ
MQEARERAEHPRHLLGGGHEDSGGILAREAEPEGFEPSTERTALPLVHRLCRAEFFDRGVSRLEKADRMLVLVVEAQFALVESGDLDFDRLELSLRSVASMLGLGHRCHESIDLIGSGLEPRPRCVHLASYPGEALAPIGSSPLGLGNPALLERRRLFRRMPRAFGLRESPTSNLHLATELELLLAQGPCLGLDLLGIAAGRLLLGLRLEMTGALCADLDQAVEPLAQPAQGEPGVLRVRDTRGIELDGRLGLDLLRPQPREQGIDLPLPIAEGGFVGDLGGECLAHLRKVIRHES